MIERERVIERESERENAREGDLTREAPSRLSHHEVAWLMNWLVYRLLSFFIATNYITLGANIRRPDNTLIWCAVCAGMCWIRRRVGLGLSLCVCVRELCTCVWVLHVCLMIYTNLTHYFSIKIFPSHTTCARAHARTNAHTQTHTHTHTVAVT